MGYFEKLGKTDYGREYKLGRSKRINKSDYLRRQKMSDSDNLKEIYSQHWQHIRHIGNERLAFTSIYVVFLGAALAYFFKLNAPGTTQRYIMLAFLLLYSYLGFLFMVRVLVTYWYHYTEIQRITPLLCRGGETGVRRETRAG